MCSGAGNGTRTRDPLLGKIVPAPVNLFEPQNGQFGPSWPSVSKTLSPLSPRRQYPQPVAFAHRQAGRRHVETVKPPPILPLPR